MDATEDQNKTRQNWISLRKQLAGTGNSLLLGDNGVLLKAIGSAEYTDSVTEFRKTCDLYGLRHKAVLEIRYGVKRMKSDGELPLFI